MRLKFSKKINLYYVEAPFQLMAAISHAEQSNEDSVVFIRESSNDKNNSQMRRIKEKYNKDEVIIKNIGLGIIRPIVIGFFYMIWLRANRELIYYATGDYRSRIGNCLFKLSKCREYVLLDDGVALLNICDIVKSGNEIKFKINMNKIGNINVRPETVSISSILDIEPNEQIRVTKNHVDKWMAFGKNENKLIDKELVYILGSKLVEEKIVNIKRYIETYRELIDKLSSKYIFYIPHRGEEREKINLVCKELNIKLLEITDPIEVYLGNLEVLPIIIGGFISAAMVTISSCFPNVQLYLKEFPDSDIDEKFLKGIHTTSVYIKHKTKVRLI